MTEPATIPATLFFALGDALAAGDLTAAQSYMTKAENANTHLRRNVLAVRFRAAGGTPEMYRNDRTDYPSFQVFIIRQLDAISRADIERAVGERASSPLDIQVTPDRNALIGWTELDAYQP